ncbi:hypothetical protein Taro_045634 [Colocasia esculenta]|uniref:Uncharacterized protein n=1 Tax=Colocasia esculenta TaxID=4460 RepID=A0A843WX23_COLES|nr:hypothetical protein [Colocasia esculenta]
MQQIEEVKCLVRVIPIWVSCILYYMCLHQQSTYVVFQALQSDRYLGNTSFLIPAASFTVFTMLALTIWIPIYDRILVPWARRLTGKEGGITVLQRMGVGIVLSVVSLSIAAVVEERRRRMALQYPPVGIAKNGGAISSMSSLWFICQLVVAGVSEGFNIIGQVEFYYKQFPENMRSIAGSFFFCGMAIASYASGLMITVVHTTTGGAGKSDWLAEDLNKGKLDYFYFFVAGVATVNFFYFVTVARWYRYKGATAGDPALDVALESKSSRTSDPQI